MHLFVASPPLSGGRLCALNHLSHQHLDVAVDASQELHLFEPA
jgi:hypothetical protein